MCRCSLQLPETCLRENAYAPVEVSIRNLKILSLPFSLIVWKIRRNWPETFLFLFFGKLFLGAGH